MSYIWVLVVAAFISQNAYFGWNALAKSDAELIADLLVLLLAALALIDEKNKPKR